MALQRFLTRKNILAQCIRLYSDTKCAKVLFPLDERRLLMVSGKDTSAFLQGLITNDMGHFNEGAKSMYAMFLNNRGRILYDTLIHKWADDSYMIECDRKVLDQLERHLKIFKLKRAVNFQYMHNIVKPWVFIGPPDALPDLKVDPQSSINVFKDPRMDQLGYRILASTSFSRQQLCEVMGKDILIPESNEGYMYLRYKLGVGEGPYDIPPATRFPLEANCDYLHGVSFHKGCYIGQELLARVHFTGVVRKRILPIQFCHMSTGNLKPDDTIVDAKNPKKSIGKLIGVIGDHGIGLLRVKEGLEAENLAIGDCLAIATKPSWWPVEYPKEKITKQKDL